MIAKSEDEIKNLRKAGKILAEVLDALVQRVEVGVTTAQLDVQAESMIREKGALPVFLGYKPEGAAYPYPATLCVSINDEVVHGIPSEKRFLTNGDIVSLDLGLSYNNYFVDSAITVCVGICDDQASKLIEATREAVTEAIKVATVGGHIGDIGAAVVRVAKKYNFGVVEDLGGHAVGKAVHEKPFIPNEGKEGEGEEIKLGMVLAIEPMLAEGKGAIKLDKDEWTYRMRDGKRAAHFEHTVLITEKGPEILTTS
ncbi:MAG: type I methionyl aminopeptidase [bacterium]|nr:type I methionyl aminopeptidase [bacterium]